MNIKIKNIDPTGRILDIDVLNSKIRLPEKGETIMVGELEVPLGRPTHRCIMEIGDYIYYVKRDGLLKLLDKKETKKYISDDYVKREDVDKKVAPKNEGFINESNLEFSDISSEKERVYTFPNGKTLTIDEPLYLNVSSSGGHRLYDADGWCHYVQPVEGWSIKWKVKEGKPNFVK